MEAIEIVRNALKWQVRLASKIPVDRRTLGEGRRAKLVIHALKGPPTTISLEVQHGNLVEVDETHIRNEVVLLGIPQLGYSGMALLIDLLRGAVPVRKAYSEGWIIVTAPGQPIAIYDSEEMIQIFELVLSDIARFLKVLK